MPNKYEDGKTAMGTQYPSHNRERKYLIFVWRDQSLSISKA